MIKSGVNIDACAILFLRNYDIVIVIGNTLGLYKFEAAATTEAIFTFSKWEVKYQNLRFFEVFPGGGNILFVARDHISR